MVRVELKGNRRKMTFGVKDEVDLSPEEKKMKILKQTGTVKDLKRDATRRARLPGKRISKSGNIYWETRKNRSDAFGKNI